MVWFRRQVSLDFIDFSTLGCYALSIIYLANPSGAKSWDGWKALVVIKKNKSLKMDAGLTVLLKLMVRWWLFWTRSANPTPSKRSFPRSSNLKKLISRRSLGDFWKIWTSFASYLQFFTSWKRKMREFLLVNIRLFYGFDFLLFIHYPYIISGVSNTLRKMSYPEQLYANLLQISIHTRVAPPIYITCIYSIK